VSKTPLLNEELAGFLESGLAITASTRDGELWPAGAWGWAVKVHADRSHLTLFLHDAAAAAMLENLEAHPEIALALDLPSTHRACQVKGRYVSSRRARADERSLVERQVEALRADLEVIGVPRAMTAAWRPWPCTALKVLVTHLYDQTPGPGTGEPLP
jgi:hypothetical protein